MPTRLTNGVISLETNVSGHTILGFCQGVPPTTASTYGSGCVIISTDGRIYRNVGDFGSPVWHTDLKVQYFTVAILTNGTTPVNVFGVNGAPTALTVTSVKSIAQDTTAGNITLAQAANTVATIAKGTTSGVVVGGASLANTVYAQGDACSVVSSSAGNSIVEIAFTVA